MKILLFLIYLLPLTTHGFPTDSFDNYVRDKLKWSDENLGVADRASDILQIGLTFGPVGMAVAEKREFQYIAGMAAGQISVGLATQAAKVYFGRQRPNKSDYRSFWSGHSSAAWAGATVFCQMDKDACVPAYIGSALTSYLRVAADRHWASDVIVGAGVGYVGGKYIPEIVWSF